MKTGKTKKIIKNIIEVNDLINEIKKQEINNCQYTKLIARINKLSSKITSFDEKNKENAKRLINILKKLPPIPNKKIKQLF